MIAQIYVSCDADWNEPEVQISGSSNALADFGKLLNDVKSSMAIDIPVFENEFYPTSVNTLIIELESSGNDRLTVTIDEIEFKLIGTNAALNKLGDSLLNFFDNTATVKEHFHLDYYEGNEVLNETNCHLVFICDR